MSVHGFTPWTLDVSHAYLQSSTPLSQNFYMRLYPEQSLRQDKSLQLRIPLKILSDDKDYYNQTLHSPLSKTVLVTPTTNDAYFLFRFDENLQLRGIVVTYADCNLVACDVTFSNDINSIETLF